ncbi:MAG: ThiF family adenylyltransferase [Chloroflexota bacterium]
MEYRLSNKLTTSFGSTRNTIVVVGCGGTGGFAAEGLCRLLLDAPGLKLLLIDGDRVEERNLGRQNFGPEDLGRYKAQALAERLARRYHRPVAYSARFLEHLPLDAFLGVGCVDNAAARAAIARLVSSGRWWVDAGNGREFGQVLVGNASINHLRELRGCFDPAAGTCYALPLPTLVQPDLLVPAPAPSCAQALAAGDQGPTINQLMAGLVVEVVRQLLEGRLSWWQVYLDLEAGSLRTVPATPEGVARLTHLSVKKLSMEVKHG